MTGLVVGDRLQRNPALQVLLLLQVGLELEAELRYQNRQVRESAMREVLELAAGMREAIGALRKDHVSLASELHSEINRSQVNASKVRSVVTDLKGANNEVEAFLGETGSNFPTSEESNIHQPDGDKKTETDINGVTLNKEQSK